MDGTSINQRSKKTNLLLIFVRILHSINLLPHPSKQLQSLLPRLNRSWQSNPLLTCLSPLDPLNPLLDSGKFIQTQFNELCVSDPAETRDIRDGVLLPCKPRIRREPGLKNGVQPLGFCDVAIDGIVGAGFGCEAEVVCLSCVCSNVSNWRVQNEIRKYKSTCLAWDQSHPSETSTS
jgi:hypothetical protein